MSDEQRCACGSSVWVAGRGWDTGHQNSQCYVGETWVQRETFELPPLELVRRLEGEVRGRKATDAALEEARRRLRDLEGELQEAMNDRDKWASVGRAQARILGGE